MATMAIKIPARSKHAVTRICPLPAGHFMCPLCAGGSDHTARDALEAAQRGYHAAGEARIQELEASVEASEKWLVDPLAAQAGERGEVHVG